MTALTPLQSSRTEAFDAPPLVMESAALG